jgi:hypothetical protein
MTGNPIIFNTAYAGTTGPAIFFSNNQLINAGGTSGYAWNNQANNANLLVLTNAGLLTAAGGVSSTLTTDATSATTGSIITAGGISCQKAAVVGTTLVVGTGWNVSSVGLCAFTAGSTGNVTAYTFTNPNGIVGYIQTVGSSTTFSTSSDERKKDWAEVIQTDYRQSIQDLWVGDYTWKVDGTKGFGVRAQQAYSVLGGLGVVKQDDENLAWGVSSEPFGFLALWGVKDLYKIIDNLTTRIAALEAK